MAIAAVLKTADTSKQGTGGSSPLPSAILTKLVRTIPVRGLMQDTSCTRLSSKCKKARGIRFFLGTIGMDVIPSEIGEDDLSSWGFSLVNVRNRVGVYR